MKKEGTQKKRGWIKVAADIPAPLVARLDRLCGPWEARADMLRKALVDYLDRNEGRQP